MAHVRRVVERVLALAFGARNVVERAGHRPPASFASRSLQVCLTLALNFVQKILHNIGNQSHSRSILSQEWTMAACCVSMVKEMWAHLAANVVISCSDFWCVLCLILQLLLRVAVLCQHIVFQYRSTQKIRSPGVEVMYTPQYLSGTPMLFWGLSLMCRPYEARHQLQSLLGLSMGP